MWIVGIPLALTAIITPLDHSFDSKEAYYAALFVTWLFAPLLITTGIVALVLFGLYKLGIGFRDLWRQFRPVRVKLPKATARKP